MPLPLAEGGRLGQYRHEYDRKAGSLNHRVLFNRNGSGQRLTTPDIRGAAREFWGWSRSGGLDGSCRSSFPEGGSNGAIQQPIFVAAKCARLDPNQLSLATDIGTRGSFRRASSGGVRAKVVPTVEVVLPVKSDEPAAVLRRRAEQTPIAEERAGTASAASVVGLRAAWVCGPWIANGAELGLLPN